MQHLSEHEILRRQTLEEIIKSGINPFPSETFEVDIYSDFIHSEFEKNPTQFEGRKTGWCNHC